MMLAVPPAESLFDEMKRYVRFDDEDGAALRAFHPTAQPHFRRITEEFYERLAEHDAARTVFTGPEQVERLKVTLVKWMSECMNGPWDEDYYQRRARIGRVHVRIALPQRYMFTAMDLMRRELCAVCHEALPPDRYLITRAAIDKILDLELAIMLETYRESFVDKVQDLERRERDLLQRRLAITEAHYQEVVEKGPALITTCHTDGRIVLYNRRCEEVTGRPRDIAIGRDWLEVFVPLDQRPTVQALWRQVAATGMPQVHEGVVSSPSWPARRVRWYLTTLPSGEDVTLCAMGLDVTEERNLAARIRRSERLASLGTMAAGLAHELRNPLNSAQLQLTLAKRRLTKSDAPDVHGVIEATDAVAGELTRLTHLVVEFLQFARPQPLSVARVDLRETCLALARFLGPDAERQGVTLTVEAPEPLVAQVDGDRMKQVLLNLVRNGVEAAAGAGHEGRVVIGARADGDDVLLTVDDNGPGLPEPDAPIFEPFYTTKSEGTGLGLAIVHRIVMDHDGHVDVDSRPGATRFCVRVPRSPA